MFMITIAVAPIVTPPQPGMAENCPARAIVSRMKRRSSMACEWMARGSATSAL